MDFKGREKSKELKISYKETEAMSQTATILNRLKAQDSENALYQASNLSHDMKDKNWNNIAPIVFNGFLLVSDILCTIKDQFESLQSSTLILTQCNQKRFNSN